MCVKTFNNLDRQPLPAFKGRQTIYMLAAKSGKGNIHFLKIAGMGTSFRAPQWDTVDAEMKAPSADNPGILNVLFFYDSLEFNPDLLKVVSLKTE